MLNELNRRQQQALASVEWAGDNGDCQGGFCPNCHAYQSVRVHRPDCSVGAALAAYKAVEAAMALTAEARR